MSTFVGVAFSEKKDPFVAAQEAAKAALLQLHHNKPAIGILFSTIHFADKRLLDGAAYILGPLPLLGATGAAVITPAGCHNYGVGLLLLASDRIKFGCGAASDIDAKGARAAGEEFAHAALKNLSSGQRDLALLFADGLIEHGSDLLRGAKDVLGLSFPVVGAASADNFCFRKTFQYFNGSLLTNSVIGAVFSGERLFGVGARHGWKPLGKPHTITEVRGNVIKKIGGRNAVCIYEDYFGKTREKIQQDLIRLSAYYPLGLYVPGESEYLLRNALRIDDGGGLVCQGDAAEGNEVRLMMGTKEWALEAASEAAQEARAGLEGKTVKGALIFESVSRIKLLGRLTDHELSRIKEVIGDVPILGLATYGEQAPLKSLEHHGESHVHNATVTVLTIAESHAHIKPSA